MKTNNTSRAFNLSRLLGPALFVLAIIMSGCGSKSQADTHDALRSAIETTMAESRDALEKFGVTEDAMRAIQKSLAKLAGQGNLKDLVDLDEIHGSSSMTAAPLASDGENGITLFIVRFAAESTTPVHDHLTWGVIHVLEGRDRYIQWERTDDGSSEGHAELRVKKEQILMPGESVYWLAPPEDIHSQETMDEEVWELVIAGRDLMSEGVTHHRHYYDPAASTVSKAIEE